ncbi:MAG: sensor histidine kinase [Lachnospiraceae bacterium]
MKTVTLKSYVKQTVDTRTADIQNQCTILCNQLSAVNYQQGVISDIIKSELTQLSNIYNGRVMVIDKEYHIVEDTYDIDEGKTILSEDVILCFRGEGTSHYDAENRYIEVTSPILDNDKKQVNGVVLVSVSTDNISDNMLVLSGKMDLVLAVTVLLITILAIVSGTIMVRPFQRITRAIGAVTEGYEDDYLKEYSYTETRLLSEAFNKMLGRMKTLDESKNQFVSNVSHELKTPLTSMKVLSDSLLAQENVPVELYKEFMGDLSEEIDRENKIINDLLALTRLEKNANTMNITTENINMLVERILKQLRPIAATRNIEVIFESFRPVNAEVDEVKLSLAITNLVENAIKYNKENGWIHVSLNADHKSFYIEVADSGVGISKEDLNHVFERFYRVDKSHSRDTGGTGLGLAIARSAIVMHRGAIKVYSQLGEGTTFTVRIPLTYVA